MYKGSDANTSGIINAPGRFKPQGVNRLQDEPLVLEYTFSSAVFVSTRPIPIVIFDTYMPRQVRNRLRCSMQHYLPHVSAVSLRKTGQWGVARKQSRGHKSAPGSRAPGKAGTRL